MPQGGKSDHRFFRKPTLVRGQGGGHDTRGVGTATRFVVALPLNPTHMRLDLDFNHGGLFHPRKRPEGGPTDRAVLLCRAEGRDFFHHLERGTVPAAVP
jgi:hypothetical protein